MASKSRFWSSLMFAGMALSSQSFGSGQPDALKGGEVSLYRAPTRSAVAVVLSDGVTGSGGARILRDGCDTKQRSIDIKQLEISASVLESWNRFLNS